MLLVASGVKDCSSVNQKNIFKGLIAIFWLCLVFMILLTFVLEPFLPQPLIEYLNSTYEAEITTLEWIVILIGAALVIALLGSSINLYRLKMKSRRTFLIANCLGVLLYPFMGPQVVDAYSAAFEFLAAVCTGAIIAMSYTTNLLDGQPDEI